MAYAERTIHLSHLPNLLKINQIKPGLWVEGLAKGEKTENEIEEEIIHTPLEFSEKEKWTKFHPFTIERNNLFLEGTRKSVFEVFYNGIEGPWSRLQVTEGLFPFFRNLINNQKPSIGFIFSPPGPEKEGYSDYGFCWFYQRKNKTDIQPFALRIDNFDAPTVHRCLDILQAFGQTTHINVKSRENETLLTSFVIVPLGQTISLPSGRTYRLKTIKDLLGLISEYLPNKLSKEEIKTMLERDTIKEIRQKFKDTISTALDWVRAKAREVECSMTSEHNMPLRTKTKRIIDISEFFQILGQVMDLRALTTGSCPAAKQATTQVNLEKDVGEQIHFCPQCSISFTGGNICPLCGQLCL